MSVGVCVNGLARTFQYPVVYGSIRCALLQPLASSTRGAVTFAVLTMTETHSADRAFRGGKHDVNVTAQGLSQALQAIDAEPRNTVIRVTDWTPKELDTLLNRSNICVDAPSRQHAYFYAVLAQLANARVCLDLIQRYEREVAGTPFAYLLHSRPDAVWLQPVPPLATWVRWTGAGNIITSSSDARFQDWAAFGTRDAMHYWFDRVGGSCAGAEQSFLGRIGSGLQSHFARVGVGLLACELPQVVLRESGSMPRPPRTDVRRRKFSLRAAHHSVAHSCTAHRGGGSCCCSCAGIRARGQGRTLSMFARLRLCGDRRLASK
jgi:hypothetical protein